MEDGMGTKRKGRTVPGGKEATERLGTKKKGRTVPGGKEATERLAGSLNSSEQLLPGLPNEVTLEHIGTKLPWIAFLTLSAVSPLWREAIRTHEVYDARIRNRSTETLIVLRTHRRKLAHSLFPLDLRQSYSLYSIRDQRCYHLPPIPHLKRGIPTRCQCISLDGKIYVLGGHSDFPVVIGQCGCSIRSSAEVYVFDVRGQRKWERRADMLEPRRDFGCGIVDGKIYVFGTGGSHKSMPGCEVYDPKANSWSSIRPMKSLRRLHEVTAVGKELFVHGGELHDSYYDNDDGAMFYQSHIHQASNLEVYHPGKNEWRVVKSFPMMDKRVRVFLVQGKLHMMTNRKIYLFDIDQNSWTELHSVTGRARKAFAVKPLNGELLALGMCYTLGVWDTCVCLLQSKGFGSENKEILWERLNCSFGLDYLYTPFKCSIEL